MADNVRFLTGDVNYDNGETAIKALPPLSEETVGQVYFITDINDLQGLIVFDTKRPAYTYTVLDYNPSDSEIKNGDFYKVNKEYIDDSDIHMQHIIYADKNQHTGYINYVKATQYKAGENYFTRTAITQPDGSPAYDLARIVMSGSSDGEIVKGDDYVDLATINDEIVSLTDTYSSKKIDDTYLKKADADSFGAVKDVQMNSTSLVDENGVANLDALDLSNSIDNNTIYVNVDGKLSAKGIDEYIKGDEFVVLATIDDTTLSTEDTYSSQKIDDTYLKKADADTFGAVKDVQINSSSILDENGIANIDSVVLTEKLGVANGVAQLDANGKVPSAQLPSYVDDVLEYSAKTSFPATGETGKIYVDTTTNLTYRWGGSAYVEISQSLALGETSSTAYAGDKGKANADAISAHTGNNDIHVTTANKTAWNAKYDKPADGIPKTDLTSDIQTSLGKADSAIQDAAYKHITVTTSSVSDGTTTFNKYTHPTTTEVAAAAVKVGKDSTGHVVIGDALSKSDIGLSNVGNYKAVSTEASQGLTDTEKSNARTNIGAGTYSKPSDGIPKTDLASAVQTSLGKADSAVQDVKFNNTSILDSNKIANFSYTAGTNSILVPQVDDTVPSAVNTYSSNKIEALLAAIPTSDLDLSNYIEKTGGTMTGNLTAPKFIGALQGNADSASKLGTNAGSTTQPIYFANGVPVAITGAIANNTTGNAATASKLETARTISLTGSITGSGTFDGSENLSITTTTNHTHDYVPLNGGTMTGNLSRKCANVDMSQTDNGISGSNIYPTTFNILDKSNRIINRMECILSSNGNTTSFWYVRAYDTNGDVSYQKGLNMTLTKAGAFTVTMPGTFTADSVNGAVWNDYAEYREVNTTEGGRCVREIGDDTLELTDKRLMRGCEITSDTWGFAQGKTEKANTPIAVAGRVLAYPLEDREIFRNYIGYSVCSGPNGTVSLMTEEEEMKYPWAIIGTVSAVPDYEEWGGGEMADRGPVKVNGRIWIKIK